MNEASFDLRQLSDRESIRGVLATYATAVDLWDIEMFSQCFTEDVEAIYNYNPLSGLEAVKRYFTDFGCRNALGVDGLVRRMHFNGNIRIELDGDQARSETYLLALNINGSGVLMTRGNEYFDDWARTSEGWRIRKRRQVTNWMTEAPVKLDPDAGAAPYG
jgi:hypothetical protein